MGTVALLGTCEQGASALKRLFRLFVLGVVMVSWDRGPDLAAGLDTRLPSCDEVCNPSVPCDTECAGTYYEQPPETVCGAHYGGANDGYCESYCGDGLCAPGQGENSSNCPDDCVDLTPEVRVNFPDDGIPWRNRTANWPKEGPVGACLGNCGAGCTQWSVCGTPFQKWQLVTTAGPSYATSSICRCVDDSDLLDCGTLETWSAPGRWTYYGWVANGCYWHDQTCRASWWNIAITITGALSTWYFNWTPSWVNLLVGFGSCFPSFASFLEGGGCTNAHPDEWSYDTWLTANHFNHEYYDQGAPGTCYSGPPKCGDGMCQPEDCGILMIEAPSLFPGNGCEENSDNCSDCS